MTVQENIYSSWEFWCYFERSKRNKLTGSESFLEQGKYNSTNSGVLRVGTKISSINSNEELIERYLVALKPNLKRMFGQGVPTYSSLELQFLNCLLNLNETSIKMKIKPFANSSGVGWNSESSISYYDIKDYYVPFDLSQNDYNDNKNLFEKIVNVNISEKNILFEDLENVCWKLLKEKSIGFTLSATGGYCSLYGPTYSMFFLRPKINITQVVPARKHCHAILDLEIAIEGKIKGKCVDKNGVLITGKQCRIIVFDMDEYKIVGTGLSNSSTGEYLINTVSKKNDPVIVSFLNESDQICGSEIMTTLSKDAT
jgi:hypothetical protein